MCDWTTTIRAALAGILGILSLLASLCSDDPRASTETGPASDSSPPITVTVSDQPARVLVTDEQEPLELEPASDEPTTRPDPAAAAAIAEARREKGSLLQGTTLGDAAAEEDAAEFATALQRVARESSASAITPLTSPVVPDLVPAPGNLGGSVLLRQAARELEVRAADSEDLRQFEEADHLRRLSTALRREARRWDERAQITQ